MSHDAFLPSHTQAERAQLVELLAEFGRVLSDVVPPGSSVARLGEVYAQRVSAPTPIQPAFYTPVLCVVAQGQKEVRLGDECYCYDSSRFLVNSMPVPASGWVSAADERNPCLWLSIGLDPALVREVVAAVGPATSQVPLRSMDASPIDVPLLEVVVRLTRLMASPQDFNFLAPLLQREIIYRLLSGPQSARVRQIAAGEENAFVLKAIERLRRDFDKPLSVTALAREAGVSSSTLHLHFKKIASMSPLQYQRQLRLQEAHRLMVTQGLDARQAGQRVGYEDPSYFSREYRRFFGSPPVRHTTGTRDRIQVEAASK